ncbi:M24 family metallopeptidase [Chloroflexota bacterium]
MTSSYEQRQNSMYDARTFGPRWQRMQKIVTDSGAAALALVPGANMVYLTGQHFHLSERPIVGFYPAAGEPVYILPALEASKLADPPYPLQLFTYTDTDGPAGAFQAALAALQLAGQLLGVEGLQMRVAEGNMLAAFGDGVQVVDMGEALAALRLHKDAAEIEAIRRANVVSQDALRDTLAGVTAGMTEREIASKLVIAMLEHGGGEVSFGPAVLTGPKSALPHGMPGDRPLNEGELLLIDYGTRVDGYPADITRTFVMGELRDQRLIDAYAAVQAANAAGHAAAGPGVPCQDVDRAARAVIEKAGFGEYFTHRTGHGLGMEVHEGPYISEGNTDLLEPGHVFTIEPGVYFPGVGGIRIEDDVVITADGSETLTTFPRELQSIG